jgi:phenylalanyl-tRNA synthetase alpha subunit
MNELDSLVDTAHATFAEAKAPAELENAKAQFLGKAGRITELMKGMAALSVDEKKSRGAAINVAKQAIEAALTERRQQLADEELALQLRAEALDVTLPGRKRVSGGLHPVSRTIRVIAPGRTYRVDSDATHSPMFHQCEGLWLGENVSFKDLKVVFTDFCRTFFESDDLVLRFRPSFFPFTEPSAEIDIQFQSGPLAGRWLEVAGSGQVHPNVVRNMGLDPERYIGFAFGMGPDRLTMLRYGVNDLRLFFDGDLRFLRQFQ